MALHPIALQVKLPTRKTAQRSYQKLLLTLEFLEGKPLPKAVEDQLNKGIDNLNAQTDSGLLGKAIQQVHQRNLLALENHLKIVPQKYYTMRWLAIGIAIFGVPIGVAIGVALGNMAFIGLGIGMGLPVGMAVGHGMDKKAEQEGRQLPFDDQ